MAFIVTVEDMNTGAASCRSVNEEVQAQIQRMQAYVAGLMGSYQGTAAQTLQQVSDEWGADAQALNYVLNSIAAGLSTSGQNYQESDQAAVTSYRNATAGLSNAKF